MILQESLVPMEQG